MNAIKQLIAIDEVCIGTLYRCGHLHCAVCV